MTSQSAASGPDGPAYDPAGEVDRADQRADPDRHLQLRRRDRSGRAEGRRVRRRAARRGRHRQRGHRGPPGTHADRRALGRRRLARRRAARARTPRRGAGRAGRLAGRPVLRRGPRRLRVGPRRGRHEGLRRDAALRRAGPGPRRRRAATAAGAVLHRRRGGRRLPGRACRSYRDHAELFDGCTEAVGEVGGFSRDRARATALPDRERREGHGLDAADRPWSGRPRLDAQRRQRGHRPGRGGGPDRSAPVAGAADADDGGAARDRGRAGRHRGHPRERRGAGRRVRRRRADARRGAAQHDQPDDARRRLQGQRHPERSDGARRRALPARLRGRVLRHARRAVRRPCPPRLRHPRARLGDAVRRPGRGGR